MPIVFVIVDIHAVLYSMRKAILNMDYPDRLKQIPTDEDLEVFEGSATS